jgi:hydrogenase maturation protein HypF
VVEYLAGRGCLAMSSESADSVRHLRITGVVQGVGFRPFVYNLATRLGVRGWVQNSSAGVEIEAAGPPDVLDDFAALIRSEAPPLARIERIIERQLSGAQHPPLKTFVIRPSAARPGEFIPISPDVAVCDDCLREVFDPQDRRYRYPFTNCTNCGPRFTIIRQIPYDRPRTTMAPFTMCSKCQAEYDDPADRRFHAQPNACPECGPHVWLQASGTGALLGEREEAIQRARQMLREGAVVAIKGLGGFHLACDATNDQTLAVLRERKGRVDKPFAIMSFEAGEVERWCEVSDREKGLLTSPERPIVLLRRGQECPISEGVAPHNRYLGVMLPYTPLHYLLLEPGDGFPPALVMTSGNYSEEPIAATNDDALQRLGGLADAFLLHDREIHARCDDSVTRVFAGAELPIRRSRGYAPYPVHLPLRVGQVLAAGAELKNTFCLTRDRYAFLSQHIGDMENYEALLFFEGMVEQLKETFHVEPEIVACDLHPGYLATRYAERIASGRRLVRVQHHHAHVASCMAENGLSGEQPVIGVAFDGTGYGTDGAIWGGEFLIADYGSCQRAAHLKYLPLPGGDAAIRRPYRTALAYLWATGAEWGEELAPVAAASPEERSVLLQQLESGLNVVSTSSVGRLFDAVAALTGLRQMINYEAQAAIELEMATDAGVDEGYDFELGAEVDPAPCLHAVASDVRAGVGVGVVAARFHNGLARMVAQVCTTLRGETSLDKVALSGGVFQNVTLLARVVPLLEAAGFSVYTHRLVPPNDGGISLGQAVVAGARRGWQGSR